MPVEADTPGRREWGRSGSATLGSSGSPRPRQFPAATRTLGGHTEEERKSGWGAGRWVSYFSLTKNVCVECTQDAWTST